MNSNPQKAEELFDRALQFEPAERAAFLSGACGNDVHLRRRVEDLLMANAANSGFLPAEQSAESVATLLDESVLTEGAGMQIGRYKLLEKLGEGGFGSVWAAEQREPVKRRVALKIIKLGMDTKQVVARFEAERQALALMDHPNIAKVLDAGSTDTGRPYFVMELVKGIPITKYCDQEKLNTTERLDLFIKVCHAIQHAHQKGIIHRDIKPSNIMVTLHDGVPVPKVIDFGIAKATQQELTEKTIYTQYSQFIGTPAYMSPEQAEMSGLDIDTRSDIYSLGVLLYELLTGTTPFDTKELMASGLDEMRKIIREREPVRPSTRLSQTLAAANVSSLKSKGTAEASPKERMGADSRRLLHELRGDLDWIAMKCLEKDRSRRYDTANGLATDIIRHLNNEPVVARPPSAAYRLQKAWRRNRLVYSAAAMVSLALVIGIAISMWQTNRAQKAERDQTHQREIAVKALEGEKEQRAQADVERQRAKQKEQEARRRAYASDMNIAKKALDENNLGHALEMLNQHIPKNPTETDLRGWEWRYLWSQTRSDAEFTLCQQSNEIHSLSISSDGNLLAVTVNGNGGLSLWSLPERRELQLLAQDEQNVCAAISPTEPLLAFTGIHFDAAGKQRSYLQFWNTATRKMIGTEKTLDGECAKLAISNDGRSLVTVTLGNQATYQYGGHITKWNLPEGIPQRSYSLSGYFRAFAATPDLGLAAVSSGTNGLRVIRLEDNRELWEKDIELKVLAFSPDGKWLAGAIYGPDILIWNAATGEEICRLSGHQSQVKSLVFWPDGKKLASGSTDQTIRIWDVPNQACVNILHGHRNQVWELALMPDQKTLVSGCRDGTVCLWDASVAHSQHARIEIPGEALAWAFEPDSKSVVTFNELGRVTRYKGADFQTPESLLETGEIPKGESYSWCFSGDARRLARGSPEGVVRVWDVTTKSLWREIPNYRGQARRLFAGGTRLLLLSLDDFVIHDLDLTTKSEVQSWRAPAGFLHFAISPDERYCVTLGYTGDAVITDLIKKTTAKLDLDARESHDGNFSPDGQLLAVPNSLGFVRIWNTTTWKEIVTLRGFFDEVYGSIFLSNGTRLAAVAGDREAVRLYDTSTWLDTLTLDDDGGLLWPTIVSPDSNVIGATTYGGWKLRLWRAPSLAEIHAQEAEDRSPNKAQ